MRSSSFLLLAGATAALASSSSHKNFAKHRRAQQSSIEKRGSGYTLETFAKVSFPSSSITFLSPGLTQRSSSAAPSTDPFLEFAGWL
jgi:hypothetical protein